MLKNQLTVHGFFFFFAHHYKNNAQRLTHYFLKTNLILSIVLKMKACATLCLKSHFNNE